MKVALRITVEHQGGERVRLPDIELQDAADGYSLISVGDLIDGIEVDGCGALRVVDRRFLLRPGSVQPEAVTLECLAFRRYVVDAEIG